MTIRATIRRSGAAALAALVSASALAAHQPGGDTLVVRAGAERTVLTTADLRGLERDTATVRFHDGPALRYEGVPLHAVLRAAGVRADSLRGDALSRRVLLRAADGYQVVFALAELDPGLADRRFLLADRVNGGELPEGESPYRLVIAGDARHARWIRQVRMIEVREDERTAVAGDFDAPADPPAFEILNSGKIFPPELPFTEAVRVGRTLYLSGQIGNVPGTLELVAGGLPAEARQTLENIRTSLEAHGYSLRDVVKCTVMLEDISRWGEFNEIYRTFFTEHQPARSAFGTSGLALGAAVEIECIAVADP